MMNKKSFLSLFLLALFLYPQIEKVSHAHIYKRVRADYPTKLLLHESSAKCAICHFEFSLFQLPNLGVSIWNDVQIFYCFILFHSILVLECINYHSVRGPPYL